ncbi:coiled-coil domain-containing protein 40 [Austrofundulus limnaeus]|uniref:Coiled-coil domain-containing protein 40 n=1 Tax=Austrofundulus limnaeus TaxID=52670 RepID=A0A2I4AKZ2_AUSLI|nr:PREDICTED: coiled-coil domain-containing protein 40-like [Austrofundulus limnaeus]
MEQVQQAGVDAQVRRRQAQDQLEVAKIKFSDVSKQRSQEEAHVTELQGKLEKMLQHLSLAQAVSKDQRSKGKTMKKAKHRAGAEKTQAEEQKLKKDLYITHLTKDLERLTQQVHMYEAQKTAQAVETKAVKQAFSEAEMKLESLMMSRKQMLQEWSNILTSTRSQYEDICAMQEAVCSAENQVIVLEKEIEAYKKATAAEEEKNETLTAQLKCCEKDCATSKRLIQQKQAEHEALQAKYSACVHSLQETQHTVSTLTKESDIYQTELDNQKKELEKEKSVLLELEDKIQSNIQQQLGHSKAAQNSQQHIRKMAALKKDKRLQLQQLENDMTSVEQESQKINEHLSSLALIQEALDEETDKYNKLLTSTQTRFSTSARLIDQKQATILSLNANISKITARTKRDDLGPLHIKVQEMTAQIKELNANIKKGQLLWLLQQEKLLGLIKDLESKSWMMHKLQTQHTAMKQKKIYLESQIAQEQRESSELEKNSKILERDLEKLGGLLRKNHHLSQALELENTLMETDFIQQIKEREREAVDIQMKVEKAQEEREILVQSLLEADQQLMLWKRKTQILKETRAVVDSQIDKEEIQKMKAEIHRKKLRINQLTKQQKKLLREGEAAGAKMGRILQRRIDMAHSANREKALAEKKRSNEALIRRIKRTKLEIANRKKVNLELEMKKDHLSSLVEHKEQQLAEQTSIRRQLDSDLEKLQDKKEAEKIFLLAAQNRCRKLRDVCEGKYRVSSSGEAIAAAQQRERERLEAVSTVVQDVCEAHPQHQGALHKLSQTLTAYKQISQEK